MNNISCNHNCCHFSPTTNLKNKLLFDLVIIELENTFYNKKIFKKYMEINEKRNNINFLDTVKKASAIFKKLDIIKRNKEIKRERQMII